MFEVPYSGEDHRHIIRVAVADGVLVPDRATGLDHYVDAMLMGDLDAVGKRKECIGSHHASLKLHPKGSGLFDGLT